MKKFFASLVLGLIFTNAPVWAATATLKLDWVVSNAPTIPASHYRIDEQVAGTWVPVATVAAPTLTYSIPGRTIGQPYTFSVVPLKDGTEGTRSNTSICGAVAPNTTLSFSCSVTVVPSATVEP